MKTFCLGDVHGAYKALKQVLDNSKFDYENDLLITLGDIVDGWGESYECVEELLKIKNRIDIRGNHDYWWYDFIVTGIHPESYGQGGIATAISYGRNILGDQFKYTTSIGLDSIGQKYEYYSTNLLSSDIPMSHVKFFNSQHKYYLDPQKNLFVHGGFNRHLSLSEQMKPSVYWWDRDLWLGALSAEAAQMKYKTVDEFNHIYIGHTTTMNWNTDKPMTAKNITNLDTGAGFRGKLSMMNLHSKEVFQSDLVQNLYPDEMGRNRK